MKKLLTTLLFLVAFCSLARSDQPNVLMIYLDDFGWKDTGFMGSDFYETPHLDALARGGMIFTDAYSCASNCAPARASLLSGQYTPRHQIFNVGTGPRGKGTTRRLKHIPGTSTLDPEIRTWAAQLQKAGYKTATMGKWHLSKDPLPYGFDVNIGGTYRGGPPGGYYPPHNDAPGLEQASENEYITDRLSEEAIKFIRDNRSRPWMLYLTHFAVHTPIQGKRELMPKYENKAKGELHDNPKMASMIQAVDDGVGKIRATLDELGLSENTVIIFFSDNGGYGPATDMEPLKGYKGTYYEGGIRVPMFVHWPGVVEAGQQTSEPVIGVDIYPTLLELCGAAKPSQPLDGVSLVPLFKGEVEALEDRSLFWHFPAYLQSYQQINDEQRDPLFRSRPCSIIRHGNWKLHQYFESGDLELYDLAEDIGETQDLSEARPEKRQELLALLERWRSEINAPVPNEKNPKFDAEIEAQMIEAAIRK
jgi:arylsulfatase A-like enzyme